MLGWALITRSSKNIWSTATHSSLANRVRRDLPFALRFWKTSNQVNQFLDPQSFFRIAQASQFSTHLQVHDVSQIVLTHSLLALAFALPILSKVGASVKTTWHGQFSPTQSSAYQQLLSASALIRPGLSGSRQAARIQPSLRFV